MQSLVRMKIKKRKTF